MSAMIVDSITITRPDDWHLHLRDGDMLKAVLPSTAAIFGRGIIMPNLKPPITSVKEARAYRERILAARPEGSMFEPLMTLYLTDNTSPEEIVCVQKSGFIHAVKYYPAGATTNSASGVTDIGKVSAVFEKMQEIGLPILFHGEVTDPEIDIFDREHVFIDRILEPLVVRNFPQLKIVLEHVTTKEAVDYVMDTPGIAATITAHHLLENRNAIFQGGIRPHSYCLPVLKREKHRQALVQAATSGNPKFFLGTDSAPHTRRTKEAVCGCAGCYTAHAGIRLYAEAFDSVDALDKLEGFASHFGADFYGLPRNQDTITLIRDPWITPLTLPCGDDDTLVPWRAGEQVAWQVAGLEYPT